MPAINMFGRRWALAADDVPVLALPAAIFHAVWFIFLVIGFSAIQKPSSCSNTASYESCIIGLFICFFLSALLESWLVREGMKGCQHPVQLQYTCQYVVRVLTFAHFAGSIFETEKRKRVVPLLYAQTAVFVAEVTFLSKSPFPANHEHVVCYAERPTSC